MKSTRRAGSVPEDVRQECREMHEDGLTVGNIAWYMGLSKTAVYYYIRPEIRRAATIKYYASHRDKVRKMQKDYRDRLKQNSPK